MVETQIITSDKNLMSVNTNLKSTLKLLITINSFQYKHAIPERSDVNHALVKSEFEIQRK